MIPGTPEYIDNHVIGLLRAEGPCELLTIKRHLIRQAQGPWDETTDRENRAYRVNMAAVASLNRLCRAGIVELYDTGDAWDLA
jgi:hypothetical protein